MAETLSHVLRLGSPQKLYESREDLYRIFFSESEEIERLMALVMTATGLVCGLILLFMPAPYGRHAANSGRIWGPLIPSRLAWFAQEFPAVLVPVFLILVLNRYTSVPIPSLSMPNGILLAMFILHYLQRSLVYPLLMKPGSYTPMGTAFLAFLFCAYNGFMQALSHIFAGQHPEDYCLDVRFLLGSLLFFVGFVVNLQSDAILRRLRQPGETGYKIPRGGAFDYVTAANYFGETLEWCGYAVAAAKPGPLAFFAFTVFNLGPRALAHHEWYQKKFEDYPKERKAYIPYVL